MGFWKNIRERFTSYDLEKLIDYQSQKELGSVNYHRAIICDIDKTYLETEFSSLIDIAKIAFEDASDKITVAGAGEILRLLRWEPQLSGQEAGERKTATSPFALHFISSSPPQLRLVLQDKLMLDGLDWTSDTFKNQAYNILKGKLALLRQHIGYKSKAILKVLRHAPEDSHFYLIGDNVETDPFIYLGVYLLSQGFLSWEGYKKYLGIAHLEESIIASVLLEAKQLKQQRAEVIFIRNKGIPAFLTLPPLTDPICYFDHFYIAGLNMVALGILPSKVVPDLVRTFHNCYDYNLAEAIYYALRLCEFLKNEEKTQLESYLSSIVKRVPGAKDALETLLRKSMPNKIQVPSKDNLLGASEDEILTQCNAWFRSYSLRSDD